MPQPQSPVRTVRSPVVTLYCSDSVAQSTGIVGSVINCPAQVVVAFTLGKVGVPLVLTVGVGNGIVPITRV